MGFLLFFLIIAVISLFALYINEKTKNKEIEQINEKKKKENEKINNENEKLLEKQKELNAYYSEKQNDLNRIQETINNANEVSRKAFENYNDLLDKEYDAKEEDFNVSVQLLEDSYAEIQAEKLAELDQIKADLDKMVSTRAAAIQAQLKEEEIQNQQSYYSLSIDDIDKREVRILQSIENELRDPRPIRMIIWTAYYSKKANDLAARVLGPNEKMGIYKITNKENKLCYIGQAKNIRERWREHMKCGLGIDTPANNKLYEAMKKEGIDNFTFELLEECSVEYLNEKEAFYINLYDSYHYGYNSNIGNKK